jgi:hypothetical protein
MSFDSISIASLAQVSHGDLATGTACGAIAG